MAARDGRTFTMPSRRLFSSSGETATREEVKDVFIQRSRWHRYHRLSDSLLTRRNQCAICTQATREMRDVTPFFSLFPCSDTNHPHRRLPLNRHDNVGRRCAGANRTSALSSKSNLKPRVGFPPGRRSLYYFRTCSMTFFPWPPIRFRYSARCAFRIAPFFPMFEMSYQLSIFPLSWLALGIVTGPWILHCRKRLSIDDGIN